jgi:type I restriction enzyme S subunit
LLEGLEISVLNLSDVLDDNITMRFDSEYFRKEYLEIDNNIENNKHNRLLNLCEIITDFGAFSQNNFIEYKDTGDHYFIRNQDIENSFIKNNKIFIEKDVYERLSLKLAEFDLLLQRTGSIGKSGMVLKKDLPSSANQNLAQVKPDKNKINPYFLNTFLNSSIGQKIFHRLATGNVQPWLNLGQIERIKIPILLEKFQLVIEGIVQSAFDKSDKSENKYLESERLLLQELGLENFTPSTEGINIKTLSSSFATTGRLDAEYYQPKYDEIVEKIKSQPYDNLINIVSIKKSIEPGSKNYSEEGLPFMRVADYSKFSLTEPQKYLTSDFVSENKDKIKKLKPKKGTILFSKDGSVGTAYHLREDFNGITSGAILHLKVKDESKIIPEYLTLALNSQVVQMQAERDAGGSIILHWRVSEIENVLVPVIDYTKQQEIAALVEESFSLKKQSEYLLEVAKKAVEIAIEEGEKEALQYINLNS